jgi:NitT/TauT family transport system permease protein
MVKLKQNPTVEVDADSALPAQPGAKKRKSAWSKGLKGFVNEAGWWFLSIGLFVTIWELLAAFKLIDTRILPPPHQFLAEIGNQSQFLMPQVGVERHGANFVALTAIVATLKRVMTGLVVGFVTAIAFGCLASYFKIVGKLTLPLITLLAPIAPIAWIPLAILAFGIGDPAAIFVVFLGIFFSLSLATVNSINNVEQLYINTARVMGANRGQIMWHVVLPAILPNLFMILRLNFFAAWMTVLAAEMVGVNTGLGAIVMVGRQMFNARLMFLGMAMIGVVGYLLDAGLGQIQKRVLWWKSSAKI